MLFNINLLAVFVAAAVAFFIGFLWHGPLFGAQWIKLMGIPQAEVDAMKAKGMGPMVPQMIAAFVQQVVTAGIMAHLMNALSITDVVPALLFAFVLWLGFIATVLLNGVLWENRKMNLYFFNIGYHLVALAAIALVIVLMS